MQSEKLVEERELLSAAAMTSALSKIVEEIVARNPDSKRLFFIGIRTGGVFLAERLRKMTVERVRHEVPLGVMDITLYRDDIFDALPKPEIGSTDLPCTLEDHAVVLVDDVLFTGRTIRAALAELIDFGRPEKVQLAVLLDRGHRELPIQPDYVGLKVETTREQSVRVFFHELGEQERAALFGRSR